MTAASAPSIESIPAAVDKPWNPGPRPGAVMRNVCEYRESPRGEWVRSRMSWTYPDVAFFNRAAGFERYRIVEVRV